MGHYKSNLRDIEFNLFEVFGADEALGQGPFSELDRDSARDVLKEVLQEYQLSDREERRLRRITQDVPERTELPDLELPPEQLAPAVLEVLESVIQFVDGYEEVIAFTRRDE